MLCVSVVIYFDLLHSSLKLVYVFTVNPHLGPLQISLGRMLRDILKLVFFVLLVNIAFSCGINQLYWYYADALQRDCDDCRSKAASQDAYDDCECDLTRAK